MATRSLMWCPISSLGVTLSLYYHLLSMWSHARAHTHNALHSLSRLYVCEL